MSGTNGLIKAINWYAYGYKCHSGFPYQSSSVTTTYAYDGIGQLTRVNDPNDTAGGSSGTTWVYEYDRGGNMTAKKRYAYTTGTLGTLQQTVSYTYGDSNWKDKLTAYNGQTFTYDAIGNVKTAEGWTYTWNRGRQLAVIKKGTSGTAGYEEHDFDYDHKGRCIGRTYVYYDTSRSTNVWRGYSYTWEGDRLVHLVTSNRVGDTGNYTTDETMHFHYDAQGKPSMLMYNGTRFGYLYNAQGDVIGIITGGLSEKVKYTYDAWGRLLSITGSSANTLGKANPFRYRAYIYDQECGLYYLRTRYYNPNWCRFINADSLTKGNLYTYCRNAPLCYSDEYGLEETLKVSINRFLVSTFFPSYKKRLDDYYIDEQIVCYSYPFAAKKVDKAQRVASDYTNTIFGDNATKKDGTVANAFKHAFWNAIMTRDIGKEKAELFSTAHESYTQLLGDKEYLSFTEKMHSDMDLYYNELGREISENKSNEYLAAKTYIAVMSDQSHVLISSFDISHSLIWYAVNGGVGYDR